MDTSAPLIIRSAYPAPPNEKAKLLGPPAKTLTLEKAVWRPRQPSRWLAAVAVRNILLRNPLDVSLSVAVPRKASALIQKTGWVLDNHIQEVFKRCSDRLGLKVIVIAVENLTCFI